MAEREETAPGIRPETHDAPGPRDHYAELDALRGVAIFGVFMAHLSGYWFRANYVRLELPPLPLNFLDLFRFGYLGVSLFFLFSGYLKPSRCAPPV